MKRRALIWLAALVLVATAVPTAMMEATKASPVPDAEQQVYDAAAGLDEDDICSELAEPEVGPLTIELGDDEEAQAAPEESVEERGYHYARIVADYAPVHPDRARGLYGAELPFDLVVLVLEEDSLGSRIAYNNGAFVETGHIDSACLEELSDDEAGAYMDGLAGRGGVMLFEDDINWPLLPFDNTVYYVNSPDVQVMTAQEFVNCLKTALSRNTTYNNNYPYNLGYYNGSTISWDCWNLGKSILWSRGSIVNNYTVGNYSRIDTSIGLGDWDGLTIIKKAPNCNSDFSNLVPGEWLYMDGHTGYYIGGGQVIECTPAWGANGVTQSQISTSGVRSKNGSQRGAWLYHGMVPWIDYGSPADTLQFVDVYYPKQYRISGSGYWLEGGTVASNVNLSTLRTEIYDANGECVSSATHQLSGKSVSITVFDDGSDGNGLKFSRIHTVGNCRWVLTATDSAGRTLSMEMPFYADYYANTTSDKMSKTYVDRPGKPALSISPGNTYRETVLSWNATERTTHYLVFLLDGNGSYLWQNPDHRRQDSGKLSFSALLPPGNYIAEVYASNESNGQATGSGRQSFTVSGASAPSLGAYYERIEGNGSLYKSYNRDCTWLEARYLAEAAGGHLVTITSQQEQSIVDRLAASMGVFQFIGAESYTNNGWRWITGESLSYSNWSDAQPDNWQGQENCGMVYSNGKWNDVPCSYSDMHGYIAEFPATDLTVATRESGYPEDYSFTRGDLIVNVTFADGTTLETTDYEIASVNTNNGEYIIFVCYGAQGNGPGAHVQVPIVPSVEGITLIPDTLEFAAPNAAAQTIGVQLSPAGAVGTLFWESTNTSVATVDASGRVTPHSVGVARITCDTGDYVACDECTVIVHAAKPLRLPAALKNIEREAFIGSAAQEIHIPEGVQAISARAFAGCGQLRLVYIPSGVENIASSAFSGSGKPVFITDDYGDVTDYAVDHDFEFLVLGEPIGEGRCKIAFNANGGTCTTTARTLKQGAAIGTLPVPTWAGHSFNGWYTAASGGTRITADATFARDMTLFAQWTLSTCTITFDANGGSCATVSRTLNQGEAIGTLPTATRTYYSLLGWFSDPNGGSQITASTAFAGDQTVYARWEQKGFGGWSGWSTTPVSGNENREVDTDQKYEQTGTKTTYSYSRYVYKGNYWNVSYTSSYPDSQGWDGYWQYATLDYPLTREDLDSVNCDRYIGNWTEIPGAQDWQKTIWYKQVTGTEPVYGYVTYYRHRDRIE